MQRLKCKHCVHCEGDSQMARCTLHNKTIAYGVACCEDIVHTSKELSLVGKRKRQKQLSKNCLPESRNK